MPATSAAAAPAVSPASPAPAVAYPAAAPAPPSVATAVPPQATPQAVATAEAAARQAAAEFTSRGKAWWSQLDPTGKKPTLIVAAALLIAILGSQVLNAIIPAPRGTIPAGGGGGGGGGGGARTIEVGGGARITAPSGWTSVGASPSLQGVRLQKGSVIIDVMVASYGGTPQELLQTYVAQILRGQANQLTVGDTAVGPAANGRVAARAAYVGIFKDAGTLQGQLTTQVWGSVGVVFDAAAPQGQLQATLGDVETIIGTLEVR